MEVTQHTPADVRERVAKIVREAMEDAGRSERLNTFVQNSMWDYTDRILALLRAPRGEGEPVAWLVECRGVEMFGWHPVYVYLGRQNAENIARVMRDGEWDVRDGEWDVRVVPLYRAALRSDAQGEDRWEDA